MDVKARELDFRIEETKKIINDVLLDQNTVICSTKFGPYSMVFLHLVNQLSETIPIVWVDTGYNRRSTVQFAQHAASVLNLNLHTFHPEQHVIRIPPSLDDDQHAAFAEEVKVAPFRSALKHLNATHWISSVRAYQTSNRKKLTTTMQMNDLLTKVHPMLNWQKQHMLDYLERYKLPEGPEVFDPTKGESFRECGLHEQRAWS